MVVIPMCRWRLFYYNTRANIFVPFNFLNFVFLSHSLLFSFYREIKLTLLLFLTSFATPLIIMITIIINSLSTFFIISFRKITFKRIISLRVFTSHNFFSFSFWYLFTFFFLVHALWCVICALVFFLLFLCEFFLVVV